MANLGPSPPSGGQISNIETFQRGQDTFLVTKVSDIRSQGLGVELDGGAPAWKQSSMDLSLQREKVEEEKNEGPERKLGDKDAASPTLGSQFFFSQEWL